MANKRVLFISQEVTPYLSAGENSTFGKELPHLFHANGYEARLFMPRFGAVNERRNQLHEVIRLSGMNISIGESDHPLIIKVASLPPAKIQAYFIDNDDFFQRLDTDADARYSETSPPSRKPRLSPFSTALPTRASCPPPS